MYMFVGTMKLTSASNVNDSATLLLLLFHMIRSNYPEYPRNHIVLLRFYYSLLIYFI